MSYYDDEQYYEPSLTDEIIFEFKEKMKEVLLESVKNDILAIKAENESLKNENKRLKDNQQKVYDLERSVKYEKDNLKRAVRSERLGELMKDFEVVMYKADDKYKDAPKCKKCDKNRELSFISPTGRNMKEKCECDKGIKYYAVDQYNCSEFGVDRDKQKLLMWYKYDEEYDRYQYQSSNLVEFVYNSEMQYSDLDYHNTYFKDKEECQKYCDWLNTELTNHQPNSKKED